MTERSRLVVGFDLDLTLIDSRPGIGAVLDAINAEHGYGIDVPAITGALGPPMDQMVAPYVDASLIDGIVQQFRDRYPAVAVAASHLLPGAHEAMQAVKDRGGRVIVVTGKYEPNALLHLQHLELPFDVLAGTLWAEGKTTALREHGAQIYVGDHIGDVRSAKAAGAHAVAVATGGTSGDELLAAGADTLLGSLEEFADWLAGHLG